MLSLAGSSRQTGCLGARGVLSLRGGSPCLRGGWARPRKECTDLRASHGRTVIVKKTISALAAGLYRCVLSRQGKERRPHSRALCGPASMLLIVVEGELFYIALTVLVTLLHFEHYIKFGF